MVIKLAATMLTAQNFVAETGALTDADKRRRAAVTALEFYLRYHGSLYAHNRPSLQSPAPAFIARLALSKTTGAWGLSPA